MIKVNNVVFGSEQFSNGEVSYKPVKIHPERNQIDLYFQDNKDIADLMFAVGFIREQQPGSKIDLNVLYVPYGRMDRPIKGYVFSLKIFADMINHLGFEHVYTLDNHSEEVLKRIHNIVELDINPYITEVVKRYKPDYFFFPDKGAMRKYPRKINFCIHAQYPYFYGQKQRVLDDSREIISYELFNEGIEIKGKKVLIIDDICCTGGTVMRAAKVMKSQGALDIALWVAHCENNVIKYDIVREGSPISCIYTSDSIIRNYHISEIETILL
jgi:ribose-phosphate pyrophosphokinase